MLLQGHTDNVGGLAFSADGSALATACEDRVIRVFRLTDIRAKNMGFMKHNMTTTPVDVAFGSAPNLLAVTARGKTSSGVILWAQCLDSSLENSVVQFVTQISQGCRHVMFQDNPCCETAQSCCRAASA